LTQRARDVYLSQLLCEARLSPTVAQQTAAENVVAQQRPSVMSRRRSRASGDRTLLDPGQAGLELSAARALVAVLRSTDSIAAS
jgi:hypothetical protein